MMLRVLRALRRTDDRGIALPTVFGVGMVMLILVATAMTVAMGGMKKTETDENWNAALSAAYAGVQEYQSRLANDNTYVRYGNPQSTFSKGTSGSTTLVMPPVTNPALARGAAGAWAEVEGSSGRAFFRYEVNVEQFQSKGRLQLRSTGRVGQSVRTIVADLKQDGFINYLYFTKYEVQDPQFTNRTWCADRYAWGDNARPIGSGSSQCPQIQFGRTGAPDVFDGPVHSNDQLYICNADFNSAVTSSATPTRATRVSGCSGGTAPSAVAYAKEIEIPPTNATDRRQTFIDDAEVARPGCLYTGPTKITFFTDGAGVAKMNVVSPFTKQTNPRPGERTGTSLAQCGAVADLHREAGSTVNALAENLIFVQDVPRDTGNVNGWAATSTPDWRSAGGLQMVCRNETNMGGWTFGSHGYPISGESAPEGAGPDALAYDCRRGDVFVQGLVGSATTVSAENYAYVTGDITYQTNNDAAMVGLIGNNGVIVWNPVGTTRTCTATNWWGNCTAYSDVWTALPGSSTNRTIRAALLSVQHTIQVQNYSRIARGTLTVQGSMAQKYRGPTGTSGGSGGSTGYSKAYTYDQRFLTTAPPKFLTPTSTTYGVTQFATVPNAFSPDGSARD